MTLGERIERPDILTYSGNYFSFEEPLQSEFDIIDVAHALSNLCRFNGHVRRFYSVAEHCVLVSRLVPPEHALAGLLHDAAEAFTGDVVRPLKQYMRRIAGVPGPDPYKWIEERIERAVCARFDVPYPFAEPVHLADRAALYIEQRALMPPHDDKWASDPDPEHESRWQAWINDVRAWQPTDARAEFLLRYHTLAGFHGDFTYSGGNV